MTEVQVVHLIAAARPNFMKVAPLWHALNSAPDFSPMLIHTGQHYSPEMSDQIFKDLRLPDPDFHLGVGSGTHAYQTGQVMIKYEEVALSQRPNWIIVAGDVNATLACALVGAKLRLPVVHLEAGLRSRDRDMPEEINRIATDAISDVLWTPSPDADENLISEGVRPESITRVGNIMLDSYEMVRDQIEAKALPGDLDGLQEFAVVTLHRPSNVDHRERLEEIVNALVRVQNMIQLVFPVHPRTLRSLQQNGLMSVIRDSGIIPLPPLPYISFMAVISKARALITDSGGLQEEATYLGIPCMTLRGSTERPITVEHGTNVLVNTANIFQTMRECLINTGRTRVPDLWDGQTAGRCIQDLRKRGLQCRGSLSGNSPSR